MSEGKCLSFLLMDAPFEQARTATAMRLIDATLGIAQRFVPASSSVGSPSGASPARFSSTIRSKFEGVGETWPAISSTKASSASRRTRMLSCTSGSGAHIGSPSNATGSLVCPGRTSVSGPRARRRCRER